VRHRGLLRRGAEAECWKLLGRGLRPSGLLV